MSKSVFTMICQGMSVHCIFKLRSEATGERGISPKMRIIAALRVLAYGKCFDDLDEIEIMSEASPLINFMAFVNEVISVFGGTYL